MSWIADHKEDGGTAQETICRVYGHRLSAAATAALSSSGTKATTSSTAAWITLAELEAAAAAVAPADHPEAQSSLATLAWVRMWVMQQDEAGCPVRRGFGVATGAAGGFINWVGGGLASCCTTPCAALTPSATRVFVLRRLAEQSRAEWKPERAHQF